MAIRSISREEFDTFGPERSVMATSTMDEVEWFADDDGLLIGFVARDKTENDWSVYVLAPDRHGTFRVIDDASATGMTSHIEARSRLLVRMRHALASGLPFPQDD